MAESTKETSDQNTATYDQIIHNLVSIKLFSPKQDPDSPPPLELNTTIDSSIKLVEDQQEYYEDNEIISLNQQDDEKSQTYRMRFYSDDISSLPIYQILSRFQSEYKKKQEEKE